MGSKANLVALLGVGLVIANFWVGWQRQAIFGSGGSGSQGAITF